MIFIDVSLSQGRNKVQRREDHNTDNSSYHPGQNIVPGNPSPVNIHPRQELGLNPRAENSLGDRPIISSPGSGNHSPGPGNHGLLGNDYFWFWTIEIIVEEKSNNKKIIIHP